MILLSSKRDVISKKHSTRRSSDDGAAEMSCDQERCLKKGNEEQDGSTCKLAVVALDDLLILKGSILHWQARNKNSKH